MSKTTMRPFSILLAGQAISLFGSVLTGFALAIWAYKESGNQASVYAIIAIANSLPVFVLGPIAGAAADRWNRKRIILTAQFAAILITAALTLLYHLDILEVWHIIALVALNSVFTAFVLPTVTATVPLMVPKGSLTRANALIALAFGLIELSTPIISGSLYENFGLRTIFLIDLCTFVAGLAVIIITFIPQPPKATTFEEDFSKETFYESMKMGISYVFNNRSLLSLVIFFSLVAACIRAIALMVQPMVLNLSDAKTLGFIMSISGSGVLFGSLLLLPFKDLSKHMPIIFATSAAIAICSILIPVTQSTYLLAAGGFILMACFPVLDTNCRVLFQRKIEPMMLGRIIGFRSFVLGIFQTAAVLGCGLLADRVFEPAMKTENNMSQVLAPIYGTGGGRGIAVLISCVGIALFVIVIISLLNKRLRSIDKQLVDIDIDLDELELEQHAGHAQKL